MMTIFFEKIKCPPYNLVMPKPPAYPAFGKMIRENIIMPAAHFALAKQIGAKGRRLNSVSAGIRTALEFYAQVHDIGIPADLFLQAHWTEKPKADDATGGDT